MWLLLIFISFGYCRAESVVNGGNGYDEMVAYMLSKNPNDQNSLQRTDNTIDARSDVGIVKAASDIASARNIGEMIKRLDTFSKRIPAELLKEKSVKPFVAKFKGDFEKVYWKSKSILEMARKLEKAGPKKNKKQLAAFESKLKKFKTDFQVLTKAINLESKKQRNKNLKIMKSHPNDIYVLEDAKRFLNITDVLYETLRFLQSIPGKIGCFIFGGCESNNDGDENVDEEEEEEDEVDPDDGEDNMSDPDDN